MLFEKPPDVNLCGGKYGTALQAAAYRGHNEIIKTLLVHNADGNITVGDIGTALKAVGKDHFHAKDGTVSILIGKGANVNIQAGIMVQLYMPLPTRALKRPQTFYSQIKLISIWWLKSTEQLSSLQPPLNASIWVLMVDSLEIILLKLLLRKVPMSTYRVGSTVVLSKRPHRLAIRLQ